ncbi:MAG: MFS transporter [Beijerinckiaceae bacterium]
MSNRAFVRFLSVSACFRASDQLAIAAVPILGAATFGLPADQIGLMVAAQGSAWLFLSLPFGLAVDRASPFRSLARAMLLSLIGFVVMIAGFVAGEVALFTFGAFLTAAAAVFAFLAEGASLQRLLPPAELPKGNARQQIVQSMAMIIGPLLMGWLAGRGEALAGLAIALVLAFTGLILASGFRSPPESASSGRNAMAELKEGFAFVRGQPLLLGILGCSLFWNLGFMALLAIFASYGLRVLGMTPGEVGVAQGAMGLASLAAALTAAPLLARFEPRLVLLFGPATSALAAALLWLSPATWGGWTAIAAFFLLGYGPILWFICQNAIRQLVAPKGMLGRVGAVIQLAMYGVRSIGALAGGIIAERYGFPAALAAITLCFVASTLVVPLSALGRLARLPDSAGLPA